MKRKHLRRLMMWQMMPHMLLGHPIAAILSLVGLWRACEWWHYYTLPPRARKKIPKERLDYCHERSVFWVDFFFAPVTHLCGAFGFYYLGFRIYMLGPLEAALEHSTHFNFLLWSQYSPYPEERERAERLLIKGRCRKAYLATVGRPRWPHITTAPDQKWIDGYDERAQSGN